MIYFTAEASYLGVTQHESPCWAATVTGTCKKIRQNTWLILETTVEKVILSRQDTVFIWILSVQFETSLCDSPPFTNSKSEVFVLQFSYFLILFISKHFCCWVITVRGKNKKILKKKILECSLCLLHPYLLYLVMSDVWFIFVRTSRLSHLEILYIKMRSKINHRTEILNMYIYFIPVIHSGHFT